VRETQNWKRTNGPKDASFYFLWEEGGNTQDEMGAGSDGLTRGRGKELPQKRERQRGKSQGRHRGKTSSSPVLWTGKRASSATKKPEENNLRNCFGEEPLFSTRGDKLKNQKEMKSREDLVVPILDGEGGT